MAEDYGPTRWLVCHVLREAGYHVLEAKDGFEALRIAEACNGTLDLLLSDISMPRLDGYQLVARVRARHPQAKVIFITAHLDHLAPIDIPVITKPFDPNELVAAIQQRLAV